MSHHMLWYYFHRFSQLFKLINSL